MPVRAGSIIRYQANVRWDSHYYEWSASVTPESIRAAIGRMVESKGGTIVSYFNSSAGDVMNIQANIKTNIDRGNLSDIVYDINSAIVGAGATILGGTGAAQMTSPGGKVPGTIPDTIQKDTFHDKDTVLGTALDFWLQQAGAQVEGLANVFKNGSTLMWIGVGVVALILFTNRK